MFCDINNTMDEERKVMNEKEQSELLSVSTHYKNKGETDEGYESVKFTDGSVDFSAPIEDEELISRVKAEADARYEEERQKRESREKELKLLAKQKADAEDVVPEGALYKTPVLLSLSLLFMVIIVIEAFCIHWFL